VNAVVWKARKKLRIEKVKDPSIQEPTDAIVRVTATGICGSDLHLYGKVVPGMIKGDILGHEAVGIVEEVGGAVSQIRPGDRVVVPANVACGHCYFCERGLQSQCETTQNKKFGKGGSLFGYTHLYGGIAGGQAEYVRVPQAQYGPIRIRADAPDTRLALLADVLPTAWQGVEYAGGEEIDTLVIYGLGPIGQACARIARFRGIPRIIGLDRIPERLALAARHGVETIDLRLVKKPEERVVEMTHGRGADAGIDAVGVEAFGSKADSVLQTSKLQADKLNALVNCMASVRRGGTVSILGVYFGWIPMFHIGDLFDRQIALQMGQVNVRRWSDSILPLISDGDELGVDDMITHVLPLEAAPKAYDMFQEKRDGVVKVVLQPGMTGKAARHAA
jgi:threonine dehydrogenase-like Zn-dependent dehydrogenase